MNTRRGISGERSMCLTNGPRHLHSPPLPPFQPCLRELLLLLLTLSHTASQPSPSLQTALTCSCAQYPCTLLPA